MKKILTITAFLLVPFVADAAPEGIESAQLLSGWQEPSGDHIAALELGLQPDWKTYWRAPGSGGIPPEFDWTGSRNLHAVALIWPRPVAFELDGITSFGYHDSLVLPIKVTAEDPSLPVHLRAQVTLGICKDICIPVTLTLTGELTNTGQPNAVIAAALSDPAISGPAAGVVDLHCQATQISDGLRVTAQMDLPDAAPDDFIIVEHRDPRIWISDAAMSRQKRQLTAVLDMVPSDARPFDLNGDDLTVTILGKSRAVEMQGCPLR
jgi:DsbC/DsbD-like thiol-disulfide interchange protein